MKTFPQILLTIICLIFFKFSTAQWFPIYTFPSCPISIATSGNKIYACTTISGVFVSTDMGMTFIESNAGLADLNTRYMITRDSLLLVGTRTGVFKSTDYGSTWSRSGTGIPENVQSNVGELIFRGDSVLVATWGNGIFLSLDFGLNWNTINNGLNDFYLDPIFSYGGRIFAGSPTGVGITESDNNGQLWVQRNQGVPKMWADTSKYEIITSFANIGDIIFASTRGSGILRSNDLGLTWNAIPTPNYYIWRTLSSDSTLLTCHDGTGVLRTEDLGTTWTDMSEGLTLFSSEAMVRSIAKINDYVYIGTWSNIMFRRPANELFTSIEEVENLKGFKVFPNPTNAEISIQSNIEMHDLKYIIFSQLGIQVLTGHLTGKIGLVNIKPLPSGLYFLQLFGNKKNQIIKIIKN